MSSFLQLAEWFSNPGIPRSRRLSVSFPCFLLLHWGQLPYECFGLPFDVACLLITQHRNMFFLILNWATMQRA